MGIYHDAIDKTIKLTCRLCPEGVFAYACEEHHFTLQCDMAWAKQSGSNYPLEQLLRKQIEELLGL